MFTDMQPRQKLKTLSLIVFERYLDTLNIMHHRSLYRSQVYIVTPFVVNDFFLVEIIRRKVKEKKSVDWLP